jgi:hypothetical protein
MVRSVTPAVPLDLVDRCDRGGRVVATAPETKQLDQRGPYMLDDLVGGPAGSDVLCDLIEQLDIGGLLVGIAGDAVGFWRPVRRSRRRQQRD